MNKKILILDDDPLIRSTLEQSLRLKGFDTQSLGNGQEGLTKVKEWHPDLILLDHHMPGMTGIEFLSKLREDTTISGTKVVYLTSDNDVAYINEAIELGVHMYLNKAEVKVENIVKVVEDSLK